jgi:hypothetical protein
MPSQVNGDAFPPLLPAAPIAWRTGPPQTPGANLRFASLRAVEDAAAHAGEIHADLERRGQCIGPCDILIAGHARSRGLVVTTGHRCSEETEGRSSASGGVWRRWVMVA